MSTALRQFGPVLRLQRPDLSIQVAAESRPPHDISVLLTYHQSLFQRILQIFGRGSSPYSFELVVVSSAHPDKPNHVVSQPQELHPGETKRVTVSLGAPSRSVPEGAHWIFATTSPSYGGEGIADNAAMYASGGVYIHYFLVR
jgi:hypothetical protein